MYLHSSFWANFYLKLYTHLIGFCELAPAKQIGCQQKQVIKQNERQHDGGEEVL